ncbi:RNA polymerase sigma factor [Fulvivirgaceae bacterium BMA10]|uniref:RNA polymerase sigma factor n=1 Tax=Splendidivirga corallicola TaxID=3051826 RepID=A0ABT8KPB2_9BACT|nr:RNA polymerase sigma factor [Fulvivirgaceae bacterium BMA10]
MLDEDQLIAGCCKGDRKSQWELYDHFSKKMMVICMRYSKGTQEAEDILQEAFIKVFKNIKNFKRESSLFYWIKRIVINTALNHQRSKLYLYPMVDVTELKHQAEREVLLSHIELNDLLEMVQSLPTGCQVIFNLYAIEGYKHKEISKMLNISEGTSKSQYARAKELLQKKLLDQENLNYERYR